MNPIQKAAQEWAIEKCQNDPRLRELGICPTCMVDYPCLCQWYKTIVEMRTYYEANRRIEGSWLKPGRDEPTATRSWGTPVDVLMEGLAKIAQKPYKEMKK